MNTAKKKNITPYLKFDEIDGSHPFKEHVPSGFVDYPARIRKGGRVSYFNFDLAKEMGLIESSHENMLTKGLHKKLLETFSIQIINEFDQMNGKSFSKNEMKSGTYMATRYLQLQHTDKTGKTSGDGRSVWNGQIQNAGQTWDVSSCGTGATRLSPATSKFNKFFETGDPSISYGCGYAELDEGLATAVLSDIFSQNNLRTEQTLLVIEYKNNISINVRAHQNLMRPSHFFLYLKQKDYTSLKQVTDYYINSKRSTEEWSKCPQGIKKYDFFLDRVCFEFASMAARFEDDYIFCWLDWDGDNILMDGSLIDYGSIRQFGLCHHEYRFDDVERFSTNLLEQKVKARYIIQTFIQMISYIKTKEKEGIDKFKDHKLLSKFDTIFEDEKKINLLHKVGFTERQVKQLLKRDRKDIEAFQKDFTYFERAKSKKGKIKVSDGETCDAIFDMRAAFRELPQIYSLGTEPLRDTDFFNIIKTSLMIKEDMEISSYRKTRICSFQKGYLKLVEKCATHFQQSTESIFETLSERSRVINRADRITGDAITHIVDKLMQKKKTLSVAKMYEVITSFQNAQNTSPENNKSLKEPLRGLVKEFIDIAVEYREGL